MHLEGLIQQELDRLERCWWSYSLFNVRVRIRENSALGGVRHAAGISSTVTLILHNRST